MIPAIKFPHGRAVLEQPRCDHCGAEWESGWDDDFMVALADVKHPCPRRPADCAARYWIRYREIEDQLLKVATFTKATCPSPGSLCDGIIVRIGEMIEAGSPVNQRIGFAAGVEGVVGALLAKARKHYVEGDEVESAKWRKVAHDLADELLGGREKGV